jgi:arylsulfatase A-like enzyme
MTHKTPIQGTRLLHLVALALALAPPPSFAADSPKPNVIFILADDLGAHDIACLGSTFYETPNLDRLAKRGARFPNAYAASPLCSPTRSSILTGQYPARIGITAPACHLPALQLEKKLEPGGPNNRVLTADSITRLSTDYHTLAESLKESGYATAHFGKWHLGHNREKNPEDRYEPRDQGFDFDFPHTPKAAGPGPSYLAPWGFIKDPEITDEPGKHIEDRMSAEAAKYIQAHKDQPFYMNYWAYSVHSPWNARSDYLEHFKSKADPENPQHNALYAAMVKSLDDGVGRILDAVDASGIADRTILVFFSDNGGYAYPPKKTIPEGYADIPATSNLPLRSGKASLYEGGTREPFFLVWPGKVRPDTTNPMLFQSTDFYPTLLSMCGLKPRPGLKLDGCDQSKAFAGGISQRDRVFCHFPHGSLKGSEHMPGFYPGTYVRKGDYKLIRFFAMNSDGSDKLELYNLKLDEGESKNLADEQPELARELNGLITDFLKDTEAVVPQLNPKYSASPAAAAPKAAADPLLGWKNRNCDAAVSRGILRVSGKGPAPFLGVGSQLKGPAKLTFRMRLPEAKGVSEGRVDLLPQQAGGAGGEIKTVPYTLASGEWQEVTVDLPVKAPTSILRLYLPAEKHEVEIDWVELRAKDDKPRRWDY